MSHMICDTTIACIESYSDSDVQRLCELHTGHPDGVLFQSILSDLLRKVHVLVMFIFDCRMYFLSEYIPQTEFNVYTRRLH